MLLLIDKYKPSTRCPLTGMGQKFFFKRLYFSSYCKVNSCLQCPYFEVWKGYIFGDVF